jgi:predicted enzyme related to lactoylglutathione lyase
MSNNKLAYLELPATDIAALKQFYGSLFGWSFQDFGDDYAAFSEAGLDGGFNAVSGDKTKAPLAIIETDAIEAMEQQVRAAGGTITMPTFDYPGGRRFHFTDPSGNELAVMQVA